jgi:hypothetical protein
VRTVAKNAEQIICEIPSRTPASFVGRGFVGC